MSERLPKIPTRFSEGAACQRLGPVCDTALVGRNGLGKTMIAQNICHTAVLAGHSVLFRSAASLLEDLHRQTPEGRRRKRIVR
jgi:DNA replication protein DnaC